MDNGTGKACPSPDPTALVAGKHCIVSAKRGASGDVHGGSDVCENRCQ
jgi:hypothetical protein